MKRLLLLFLLSPLFSFCQETLYDTDSIFNTIPLKGSEIVYEEVFKLDSINDKVKVFNAAKAALMKNTNYKYTKVDEDRVSGTIETEVVFSFKTKQSVYSEMFVRPTFFDAKCKITIDVKENRFRVRLTDNVARAITPNTSYFNIKMEGIFLKEKEMLAEGELKYDKSLLIKWDSYLDNILKMFGTLIKDGVKGEDDF